jgi:hypothetical protein
MLRITLVLLLFAAALSAQTASVTGRITDSTGSVVPGAVVTATSTASGVESSTVTSQDGFYNLLQLPPGSYDIRVSKAGFRTERQTGLELLVQQVARLDFSLELGAITETISVQAQGVVLESESSTVGQVVHSKQITELPLLGRNTYALALLVPGVRPSNGVNNLVVGQISTVS